MKVRRSITLLEGRAMAFLAQFVEWDKLSVARDLFVSQCQNLGLEICLLGRGKETG